MHMSPREWLLPDLHWSGLTTVAMENPISYPYRLTATPHILQLARVPPCRGTQTWSHCLKTVGNIVHYWVSESLLPGILLPPSCNVLLRGIHNLCRRVLASPAHNRCNKGLPQPRVMQHTQRESTDASMSSP